MADLDSIRSYQLNGSLYLKFYTNCTKAIHLIRSWCVGLEARQLLRVFGSGCDLEHIVVVLMFRFNISFHVRLL
jgi:hypothetical protein